MCIDSSTTNTNGLCVREHNHRNHVRRNPDGGCASSPRVAQFTRQVTPSLSRRYVLRTDLGMMIRDVPRVFQLGVQ